MLEEHVVAGAEGRQAGVSAISLAETMLGTFSVAEIDIFACDALRRKGVTFVKSETMLQVRRGNLAKMPRFYISCEIFRIDEMIAGIHVSVMLHYEIAAACGCIGT